MEVPSPLTAGEPISFVGLVLPYDAQSTGTFVRIDFHRRLANGLFEESGPQYQGTAFKKDDGQLHYSIPGQVPRVPGTYQFLLRSVGPTIIQQGPTADLTAMDSYLMGTFEVTAPPQVKKARTPR